MTSDLDLLVKVFFLAVILLFFIFMWGIDKVSQFKKRRMLKNE